MHVSSSTAPHNTSLRLPFECVYSYEPISRRRLMQLSMPKTLEPFEIGPARFPFLVVDHRALGIVLPAVAAASLDGESVGA